MGKGILNEHHPLYGGLYAGANSLDPVREEVEAADFVLYVGSLKSDFNSGSFSVHIREEVTVKLHSWTTSVGYANFPTTDIRHVLPRLIPVLEKVTQNGKRTLTRGESVADKVKAGRVLPLETKAIGDEIVHKWLWGRMGSWFMDNGESEQRESHRAVLMTRYHRLRDGHLVVRSPANLHPQPRDLCLPGLVGRDWLECRCRAWRCPGGARAQRQAEDVALRR
jgi:hypothetical protein